MPETELADQIRTEQLRMLFRQLPLALAVNLFNGALTVAVLGRTAEPGLLALWFSALVLVSLGRWRALAAYRRCRPEDPAAWRLGRAAALLSTATGALWGVAGAGLAPPGGPGQPFLIFVIGGMCAGAIATSATHLPSLLGFVLAASLPVAFRFLVEGTLAGLAMAAMTLLFAAAMALTGRSLRRSADATLRLQLDLARRSRELSAANERLRAEIDERQRVETALSQLQKLEAIGQITSGVAHDFNNLLTGVLGNLELLRPVMADERPRRLLDAATRAAERGARLTRQLLAFSRSQQLSLKPLDLNQVVAATEPLLRSTLGGSIALALEPAPDLWPARGDATQLELALLNLALNARDAMAQGGRITIRTENRRLGPPVRPEAPAEPGDYVAVTVADTGAGMPPEILAQVFEPFFTTKPAGKGAGLGLAQVLYIARQLQGGVTLESRPGAGTSVTVYLPRSRDPVDPAEPGPPAALPALDGTCVLVVDDDADARQAAADLLEALGCRAMTAESGEAALAALGDPRRRIDALLLDLVMPGLDGTETARRAAALRPGLPILFVSGHADPALVAEAVPADRILLKPFGLQRLAEQLGAALEDDRVHDRFPP